MHAYEMILGHSTNSWVCVSSFTQTATVSACIVNSIPVNPLGQLAPAGILEINFEISGCWGDTMVSTYLWCMGQLRWLLQVEMRALTISSKEFAPFQVRLTWAMHFGDKTLPENLQRLGSFHDKVEDIAMEAAVFFHPYSKENQCNGRFLR